eukprot:Rmarinus@m.24476
MLRILLIVWTVIYLVHKNLEPKPWYRRFLEERHLRLSFGCVIWYTTALNDTLYYFGRRHSQLFATWFSLGVICGVIGLMVSVVTLFVNLYLLASPQEELGTTQVLAPLIPGVNLPTNHLGYVFFAVLFSVVIHEIGHALAAGAEGIHILKCGVFFVAMFPGAFVTLQQEITSASIFKQLKIYCAGSWHNVMTTFLCVFTILWLPVVLSPVYVMGNGAIVTRVDPDSPFHGYILPGDAITSFSGCEVSDTRTFGMCVLEVASRKETDAYCFYTDDLDFDSPECCLENYDGVLVCFSDVQGDDGVMENAPPPVRTCLSANSVIDAPVCSRTQECNTEGSSESVCMRPSVPEGNKLVSVGLINGTSLVFMGYPEGVYYALILSDYAPRLHALKSWNWFMSLDLPRVIEKSLRYVASVSIALALLNMAPVLWLDGEMSSALFLKGCIPAMDSSMLEVVRKILVFGCTGLLGLNVFFSLFTLSPRGPQADGIGAS